MPYWGAPGGEGLVLGELGEQNSRATFAHAVAGVASDRSWQERRGAVRSALRCGGCPADSREGD